MTLSERATKYTRAGGYVTIDAQTTGDMVALIAEQAVELDRLTAERDELSDLAKEIRDDFARYRIAAEAEVTRLTARVGELEEKLDIIALHDGYTKLHPDENASPEVQAAYSEGVTAGYVELSRFARAALKERGT